MAFKLRQNQFPVGALPRTRWWIELTTLPRSLSRLEREHPLPYPTPLGTDQPLALAMHAARIPAYLRL